MFFKQKIPFWELLDLKMKRKINEGGLLIRGGVLILKKKVPPTIKGGRVHNIIVPFR